MFYVAHLGPHKGILTIARSEGFTNIFKRAKALLKDHHYEEMQLLILFEVEGTDAFDVVAMSKHDGEWLVDEAWVENWNQNG